tara:strand:- start:145 stop:369 length:225 start_codon:yes stop_codon:yes gene_type:complete
LCAATDEEDRILLMVERVINLWCECGKPIDPPVIGKYYVSGTWYLQRLHKDFNDLKTIKQERGVRAVVRAAVRK